MTGDIEKAFIKCPELIAYDQYAMQVVPYVKQFDRHNIHLTSLGNLKVYIQGTLAKIGKSLDVERQLIWQTEMARVNTSAERMRCFPLQTLLFDNPIATKIRCTLVPHSIRDWVKLQKLFPDYDGLVSGCRFSCK